MAVGLFAIAEGHGNHETVGNVFGLAVQQPGAEALRKAPNKKRRGRATTQRREKAWPT